MPSIRFRRSAATTLSTVALSAVLGFAACASGQAAGPQGVASVTVAPNAHTLAFATSVQLAVTLKDAAGSVLSDRAVTWSSSDTAVVTISATGLAVGVGVGAATISANYEGMIGAASVTVSPITFASIGTSHGLIKKRSYDFFAKPYLLQRQLYGEQKNKIGRHFLENPNRLEKWFISW
jgi:hypothetical protein